MVNVAWSQARRPAVAAVTLAVGAGLVGLPVAYANLRPAAAAHSRPSATHLAGFSTQHASVRVGGELWSTVTALPHSTRVIRVQYRRAGTHAYRTAATQHTSTTGTLTLGLQPPAAGSWQFRAVVAATSRAAAYVSPPRTVVATGRAGATSINGYDASHLTIGVGSAVTDDVVLAPHAARVVQVQVARPGSNAFVTQSAGAASRTGAFHAVYRPSGAGVWHVRLVVLASSSARGATSPTRTITVTDTGAAGGGATGSPTPPPATGGGTGGSTGGSTGGGSGGGTPVPPAPVVTTAALHVHVAGYPGAVQNGKLTVGQPFAFDASASVATAGRTLVSGSIDYGDSQTDPFTDPNGPLDYWNTLHSYAATGTYTATLTVTDSAGTTDTTPVTVHVYDAPTAALHVASTAATVGVPVTLGLDTTTPAGTALESYELIVRGQGVTGERADDSFDVSVPSAPPSTHDLTFPNPGTYTVALCVEDDAGSAPTSAPITVTVAP